MFPWILAELNRGFGRLTINLTKRSGLLLQILEPRGSTSRGCRFGLNLRHDHSQGASLHKGLDELL